MKKNMMCYVAIAMIFLLKADTETVDGYTWTYRIIGETAEIISPAISPSPAGVVTIPSMLGGYPVTSIGNDALYGCSLICVTIPNSVTNIGLSAFSGCHSLAEIIVEEGNTFYKSLNALLLTKDGETLVHGVNGIVDIPDGVLNITNNAFSGCSGLTNVMIPSSVTIIGDNAFRNCTGLANVIVPNSVKSIGSYAFSGCDRLTTMMIPSDVAYIGSNAFAGTPFYSNQPDGLVILGTVLYKIKGICPVEVIIPNGVTSISPEAFYKRDLTSVTIPDSAVSVGSNAFWGCSELTSVTIPDSVTSIGNGAFDNCYSLTSITIPQCVFCDGYSPSLKRVFGYSYQAITNVVISEGVTNIVDCAFTSCRNLTGVTIPGSVTRIGSSAFRNCSGLTSVTIPDSVTSIGRNAFDGCSGLTSVTMPDSVTSIGEFAFRGTPLYDDHPEGLVILGKVLYGIKGCCPAMINIPDGVISISADAFSGCLGLTSVTIPNSVTNICYGAFSGCSGLTSVTIPNSVTRISERAFYNCSGLTSVTIPNSVTHISLAGGSSIFLTFWGCNGLSEIIVEGGNPIFKSENGLLLSKDGKWLFKGVNGSVAIPNGVTSITDYAFEGCRGLTSVTIPDSVTMIGDVFSGCDGLMRASFLGKVPGCYVTYAGLGSDGGRSIEYDYDGRGPSRFDNTTNPLTVTKIGFPSGDWPIYVTEAWDGYGDTWFGHPVKRVRNTEVTVEGKALSIPGAWMAQYPSVAAAAADDAGSAVEAVAANGRKVWECYALGLDPEKADEDFKIVLFPMKADGTPDVDNIVFDPPREKWNAQGACAVLQGASELGGEWRAVTEENKASFRFFKVVVELP